MVDICNFLEHGAWPALFPQCMVCEPRNPLAADVPGLLCLPVLLPHSPTQFSWTAWQPPLYVEILAEVFVCGLSVRPWRVPGSFLRSPHLLDA